MFSNSLYTGAGRINSHERLPSISQALREVDLDSSPLSQHFPSGLQFPVLSPRQGASYPPRPESWGTAASSYRAMSVDSASFSFSDAEMSYGDRTSNSSFSMPEDDDALRPRIQRDDRKVEKERDARKGQQDVTTYGEDAIEAYVPTYKFRTDQIESNANRSGLHHTKIENMSLITGLCVRLLDGRHKEALRYGRVEESQMELCSILDSISKHGILHGTLMDGSPKCQRAQRSDAKACELHGGSSHRHCRKRQLRETFDNKQRNFLHRSEKLRRQR